MQKSVSNNVKDNIKLFDEILGYGKNFDVLSRRVLFAERECAFYYIDGFVKDDVMQKLMQYFNSIKKEDMPENATELLKRYLPYIEVNTVTDVEELITSVLSGMVLWFIDGYHECITIDTRTYPTRSVEEPDKDKVIRGSRDGFVETIVFNTALIRRRIRNPKLRMQMLNAGTSSKTDIVLCYMEDRVNQDFLKKIVDRINGIRVDSLSMNHESLAELLYPRKWINPFPKYKYSERPDTTAATILEGSIAIIVDGSPSAMLLPTTIFDVVEEADDYYFPPVTGTYLKLSRFIVNILAVILTPTFLLLTMNPDFIPEWLEFIKIKDEVNVPIAIQLLILEFAIDGLRLASINTPSMLSTPLSVVAGLIIGDFATSSGWFNPETMLYMAFVTLANYTQASFELGYALKFFRLITVILTGIFNVWGFAVGLIFTLLSICFNRTISGKSYLYPLIPFNGQQLFRRVFRINIQNTTKS